MPSTHKTQRGPWYESREATAQAIRERHRLAAVAWLRDHPGKHRADALAAGLGVPVGAMARLLVAHPAYFVAHRKIKTHSATTAMTVELHPHLAVVA